MKKILIATAAIAVVATPIAAAAQPFDRDGGYAVRFDNRGYYRYGRYDGGGAVAAGLFGLFLGAAIANSQPAYVYPPPYPVRCDWETRAYPGPYGTVTYQQVQVCR